MIVSILNLRKKYCYSIWFEVREYLSLKIKDNE